MSLRIKNRIAFTTKLLDFARGGSRRHQENPLNFSRKIRPWRLSVLALSFVFFVFSMALSQEQPTPLPAHIKNDISQNKKRLAEIQKNLEREKKGLKQTQVKEKKVLNRLKTVGQTLGRLKKEKRSNEQDLQETRLRLGQLKRQIIDSQEKLDQSRDALKSRLKALYRMSFRKPVLGGFLASESFGDLSRQLKFERLLADSNEKLVSRTLERRTELGETSAEWNDEEKREQRILAALGRKEKKYAGEQKTGTKNLALLQKKEAKHKRSIQDWTVAARKLNEKLASLLRKYATVEKGSRESYLGKGLEVKRGAIPWPVSGRIVSPFGKYFNPEFDAVVENTGIQIQAERGTPFQAVAAGMVRYADWFKGYGKLVILDHGQGYYSLYAQAADLSVGEGQKVEAGQVLGMVGDTGPVEGSGLYFEIRQKGKPLDPVKWLGHHR